MIFIILFQFTYVFKSWWLALFLVGFLFTCFLIHLLLINHFVWIIVAHIAIFIDMCLVAIGLFKLKIWNKFIIFLQESINLWFVNLAFIVGPNSIDLFWSPEYLKALIMNRNNFYTWVHFISYCYVRTFSVDLFGAVSENVFICEIVSSGFASIFCGFLTTIPNKVFIIVRFEQLLIP